MVNCCLKNSRALVGLLITLGILVPDVSAAQSVLERVLGHIEGSFNTHQINGIYANIAESVAVTETQSRDVTSDVISDFTGASSGTVVATLIDGNGNSYDILRSDIPASGSTLLPAWVTGLTDHLVLYADGQIYTHDGNFVSGDTYSLYGVNGVLLGEFTDTDPPLTNALVYVETIVSTETYQVPVATAVDGSITNIINGVAEATSIATASLASATEFTLPKVDYGNIATTALGAVNTGDITLGVNSAVDEARTTYTNAISAALTQIGGSVDTGAIIINVASNMSAVDGSVTNVMHAVNGSIVDISTTALGAVNTGTIVNGVNAAVQGIVGISGQTSF